MKKEFDDTKLEVLKDKAIDINTEDAKKLFGMVGNSNNNNEIARYKYEDGKVIMNKEVTTKGFSVNDINVKFIQSQALLIAKENVDKVQKANMLFDTLPDLALSSEILVSSVLSPNSLSRISLNQDISSTFLPTSIKETVLSFLWEELVKGYNLSSGLYDMVETSLVKTGAYCEILMGERSLDAYIQGVFNAGDVTAESITNKAVMNEMLNVDTIRLNDNVTISTNLDLVMLTDNVLTTEDIQKSIDKKKNSKDKELREFFRTVTGKAKVLGRRALENSPEDNIGRPLRMKVPMESVVPIHIKSEPSKHIGYLLLLDDNNIPIKANLAEVLESEQETNVNTGEILTSKEYEDRLTKDKKRKNMFKATNPTTILDSSGDITQEILNNKLTEMLNSKGVSNYISDEDVSLLYNLMFVRANKALKTNVVFIPESSMFYLAYKYADNGCGIGILDGMHENANDRLSLRAAKIYAQIKSSIPEVNYDVKIDNDDQDPKSTSASVIKYIMETRAAVLPNSKGILSRSTLSSWAQNLGVSVNIKHDKLPDIDVNKEINYGRYEVPDTDIEDEIKAEGYMRFSLTPEMVTKGFEGELATKVRMNNALFTKRIIRRQEETEAHLLTYIKKIIDNDAVIYQGLKERVNEGYSSIAKSFQKEQEDFLRERGLDKDGAIDFLLREIMDTYSLNLSRPLDEDDENKIRDYSDYEDFVDDYLERTLGSNSLPDKFLEVFDGDVDKLIAFSKNKLLDKWMVSNNYNKELVESFKLKNGGEPTIDIFSEYNDYAKSLLESFETYKKNGDKESFYGKVDTLPEPEDTPPDGPGEPDKVRETSKEEPVEESKVPKLDEDGLTTESYNAKDVFYEEITKEDYTSLSYFKGNDEEKIELENGDKSISTMNFKIEPKSLFLLAMELSVSSSRKLLGAVKGVGRPNNYHARIIHDLLYTVDIGEDSSKRLYEIKSVLLELKNNGGYEEFLKAMVKHNYANMLGSKASLSKGESVGVSDTIRTLMGDPVFKEIGNLFNSHNSLYVGHANYLSIVEHIKSMVQRVLKGERISSMESNVELNWDNDNYNNILDPNNVYFIGEMFNEIENTTNLDAIYFNIDVTKTIELHKEDVSDTIVVMDGEVIDLLDLTNIDSFLPDSEDGKVLNPYFSQRLRLMVLNYQKEVGKEFSDSLMLKEEYEDSDRLPCLKGVVKLKSKYPNEEFSLDTVDELVYKSKQLNLGLLIKYAMEDSKTMDGHYGVGLINELKTLFDTDFIKKYVTATYIEPNVKGVSHSKVSNDPDLPWNNLNAIVKNIITGEVYKDSELVDKSPLLKALKSKIERESISLINSKRDVVITLLDAGKEITDIYGRTYESKDITNSDGTYDLRLVDSIKLPVRDSELTSANYIDFKVGYEKGDFLDSASNLMDRTNSSIGGREFKMLINNYINK